MNTDLKKTAAAVNSSAAMETETIQKNVVGSKNHTNKRNFTKGVIFLVCIAMLGLASCSSIDSDAKKLAKLQYKAYQLEEQQKQIVGNAINDVVGLLSGSKKADDTKTAKLVKEVQELTKELDGLKTKLEKKYSAEELQQLHKMANEKFTKLKK
jgi:predicted RND superfamily exporter protein